MKQLVIRVLWPQARQSVEQWQCEYCLLPTADGEDSQVLCLPEAFQQAAIRQLVGDMDVTVLLPGELAILNCVQLPARSQRQALQALPFVVEEQLADDICDQTNLRLKAIYVDAQMLPASNGRLSILMHDDRVLFHSSQAAAVFDHATAASMIHFLLGESVVSDVQIQFQAENEQQALLAQQLSTEFSALGETQVAMEATVGAN
ncbi:MAG: hypothetical protein IPK95_08130 [Cellvibrionales bacterium]|nr:hypothetical protein [Cellvibrionales bacterium]